MKRQAQISKPATLALLAILTVSAFTFARITATHAAGNPSYTIFIRTTTITYCQVTSTMQNALTDNGTQFRLVVFGHTPNTNWTVGGPNICYAPTNATVNILGG